MGGKSGVSRENRGRLISEQDSTAEELRAGREIAAGNLLHDVRWQVQPQDPWQLGHQAGRPGTCQHELPEQGGQQPRCGAPGLGAGVAVAPHSPAV